MAAFLEVEELTKTFGGLRAVDRCSLRVRQGAITGLIGPNGAGKTTLFNLLTGFQAPDGGRVRFRGEDITGLRPYQVFRRRIYRTFQIPREFRDLTVLENLMVVPEGQQGERLWTPWLLPGRIARQERAIRDKAREVLTFVGLAAHQDALAWTLSGGLAEHGADVVAVSRTATQVEQVAAEIAAMGRKALALRVDTSSKADVDRMVARTLEAWDRIDVLVNNAGIDIIKPAVDYAEAEWDQILDMEGLVHEGARVVVSEIDDVKLERARREFGVTPVGPDEIYGQACDVFAPYALGGILNDRTVPQLRCRVVCGSANNQLAEERHGDELQARGILYAPDYIANAGGTIFDTDRLRKGGFNRERAWRNVERIRDRMAELIALTRRDGIATWVAADRLAEHRLAMARSLRMI